MKKLLIIIVTVLLISNTGTKNVQAFSSIARMKKNVVGLVQCFQAEERRKHISLERELINVGLIRKGAFTFTNEKKHKQFVNYFNQELIKRKFKPYKLNQPVKHVKTKKSRRKRKKGKWIYKYTVDPYSFFENSVTHKIRIVQTTSTVDHVVHTVIEGVTTHSSPFFPSMYYNPAYKHLLGA